VASACYVYAVVGRDTPVPSAVRGSPALTMVPCGGLAAVTERIDDERAAPTLDAVLRHEAVVEAVLRRGRALPVRFGTVFPDARSVAAALADRYEALTSDLDRLGDKVELSLSALWATGGDEAGRSSPPRETASHGAGATYLHARAADLRREDQLKVRAAEVARDLDRTLGPLALERRHSLLPSPAVAVRVAYLLDSARVGAFRAAVEDMRDARAEPRLVLTGPWPPYSFVESAKTGRAGADDSLGALAGILAETMRVRPHDLSRRTHI
jgi:hypothetical protein